ncbi:MAG: histidine kinase dimerization/phospho-acceptor domain-containing protein [Streptococcus sp.]
MRKEKRFNQNVSHELRTPLSVILSESEFGSKYADSLEESKESHTTHKPSGEVNEKYDGANFGVV